MFVLVVGGGKVGYYLTKELSESGHEVVLMEKDRQRADQIADEIGSIVVAKDGCEGSALGEAGANRADIVAAVTGDDEDNLVVCQMAKHHFSVPKTIARVNNPKNEPLFEHLGVDEIISPTRMVLGNIEQDIPVFELLHLAPITSDFEIVAAHLDEDSPAVGKNPREIELPGDCAIVAIVRDNAAQGIRPDTILQVGDKVIATGRLDCEPALHDSLIGPGSGS
jgi:trk system potassium uptake protein TrkA